MKKRVLVQRIRQDQVQCMSGRCDFFRNGVPSFADSTHIIVAAPPKFRAVFKPGLIRAFVATNQ
jgi:hypothetical protein